MYTNDNDLYFILSMVNIAAYIVPVILLGVAVLLFAMHPKKYKQLSRIIAAVLIAGALIIGFFAYSGQLKPRCCGEGYTLLQVGATA